MTRLRTGRAALVAAGSAAALLLGSLPAAAVEDVRTSRLAGDSRFTTAGAVAGARSGVVDTVLLARADDFPDALAGAGLAGAVDAPVLLTHRAALPVATRRALEDLSVRRVLLLGGPAAIGPAVEADLARDHEVVRVAGADRWATAAEAARQLVQSAGGLGEVDGRRAVLLASGLDFADALAGGPVAYAGRLPVLLTDPQALPAPTVALLDELDPELVVVLGGEAAVSAGVQAAVEQRGAATRRLGGADRQVTAARIADFGVAELGFNGRRALLARGDDYPDALAGAPHGGRTGAPVLLTASATSLGQPTQEWLQGARETVEVLEVLGGRSAVAAAVVEQAERAAETGAGGAATPFPADRSPHTATASEGARLNVTDVDAGVHEGYDRLVLGLDGSGEPGWRVEYVDEPRQQGSGALVDVPGQAFLRVVVTGVVYPTADDGQPYEGPDVLRPEGAGVVVEAQVGGVFEARREVFVGLSSAQPFRVFALSEPTRVVVDVRHP